VTTTSPDPATSALALRAEGVNDLQGGDGVRSGNGAGCGDAAVETPLRRPGAGERCTFVVSAVAITVYLILAYLVFVRPGVHREDHVLATLLPVAILALSAELYPRLIAGLARRSVCCSALSRR
jgi:hypothetical protein